MIADQIGNITLYKGLTENLDSAINYIVSTDLSRLPPGRYEIDGDRLLAVVLRVKTRSRENCKWESHQNYIEIPIVLEGRERMVYQPAAGLEPDTPWNAAKDIRLYKDNGVGSIIQMGPGDFSIFFPNDGHMPCLVEGEPLEVKKIIVKAKV